MKNVKMILCVGLLLATQYALADGLAKPELVCQQTDGDQWYEIQILGSSQSGQMIADVFYTDTDTNRYRALLGHYKVQKKIAFYPNRILPKDQKVTYSSISGSVMINGKWSDTKQGDFTLSQTGSADKARYSLRIKDLGVKFSSPLLDCR